MIEIDIADLPGVVGRRIDEIARRFAVELFSAVVQRSPVDTGRFRANWNVGYGSPVETTSDSTDANAALTAIAAIENADSLGVIWLTNSLPYARHLEYGLYPDPPKRGSRKVGEKDYTIHTVGGYSMQAPQGMIRVTVAEFASHLGRAAGGVA